MFSFRRRSSKRGSEDKSDGPQLNRSPSLPKLPSQGIPWPANLVDVASIRQDPPLPGESQPGARKTSFQGVDRAPVSFHKPFRGHAAQSTDSQINNGGTISSLYTSNPPSSFEIWKASTMSPPSKRPSQRKTQRLPPTFNLMVVGGQGTGKTSLLRLLLETADISPTATTDQRSAMSKFLNAGATRTQSIQTACVEICESRFDRVLLSVIDTPGLDFSEGRELRQERQVSSIIRYLDSQYADTMSEESKVVRQSKGDQHIHLCIYMVDPSSIMTNSARRHRSSMPSKTRTRSEATIASVPPSANLNSGANVQEDSDEELDDLTMSPAEIRVIRRLSARANVLPVIARADSLTDDTLSAVKETIRRDLKSAGLDFGVFGPAKTAIDEVKKTNGHAPVNGSESISEELNGVEEEEAEDSDDSDVPQERPARPVIKLRPGRHSVRLSRSRSRRDLKSAAEREGATLPSVDRESIASVRFSAHIVAKTDLSSLLPFALIAPENARKRKPVQKARPASVASQGSNYSSAVEDPSENGHAAADDTIRSPISPSSASTRNIAFLQAPPDTLKGVFTRKFRWGAVDVLNPDHCDFSALRTAVLSTHLKMLKTRTREVLYEQYRTEKLLAWRATRNVDQEETQRMLDALQI